MPGLATVEWEQARGAVGAVVPRVAGLLRSVRDPVAPALGEWNVAEVATHLTQAWEGLPRLALTDTASPLRDMRDLAGFTTALVHGEPERDPHVLAGRIEAAAAGFLDASATAKHDDRLYPWLVEGTQVPFHTFFCHLLSESLVHAYDIARAERRPWTIERSHAALALMGFVFPVMQALDARAIVDQEKAAGLRACYDLRLRGGGQVFVVFSDGALTVEGPSSRGVDCHISADPTALLLVVWGRQSQWSAIRKGRLVAWGRRPWLGPKLMSLIRTP
ncbi:MAG: SCP2 sterol-binding domain-containing protein [Egibacteraceae bacterium]